MNETKRIKNSAATFNVLAKVCEIILNNRSKFEDADGAVVKIVSHAKKYATGSEQLTEDEKNKVKSNVDGAVEVLQKFCNDITDEQKISGMIKNLMETKFNVKNKNNVNEEKKFKDTEYFQNLFTKTNEETHPKFFDLELS